MSPIIWKLLSIVSILMGLIGVVLPVVPTVPFLLLAAAAASRGWPWLDYQLTSHATYGPLIKRWRERGAVPRFAKRLAIVWMVGSSALLWVVPLPLWLRWAMCVGLAAAGWWIWTRPEE